jgi:hypothetical protein
LKLRRLWSLFKIITKHTFASSSFPYYLIFSGVEPIQRNILEGFSCISGGRTQFIRILKSSSGFEIVCGTFGCR